MINESWRPIPGWEEAYEVSDLGRVRSIDRLNSRGYRRRGTLLKPSEYKDYLRVNLFREGRMTTRHVHRLVLEAFRGPCPAGMESCHENRNRRDNRLSNLRWDTRSENEIDKVRHGTHQQAIKTHCPRGHELASPNLVPSSARQGYRACLACSRANTHVRRNPILDMQSESDRHYSLITGK